MVFYLPFLPWLSGYSSSGLRRCQMKRKESKVSDLLLETIRAVPQFIKGQCPNNSGESGAPDSICTSKN